MGKIKIHEIAKEIGLTSKEIIEKANELGIEAKSHMSGVDEKEAEKIKKAFSKNSKSEENKKAVEKSAPVIIRREVIISDEEDKKQEKETKQKEQKSKQVGFVERNKNADYNIVYRNKPTKPMTVSELFGIGKKEEPKKEEKQEIKKEEPVNKQETMVKTEIKQTETKEQNKNFENRRYQNNNYENRNHNQGNYQNRENNYRNNQNQSNGRNNYQGNRQNNNGFQNRDNRFRNNNNNNQNRGNNNGNNFNRNRIPLDEKGIDKNIKDIMATDIVEKENQRDFTSKAIDKAKFERKEEKSQKSNKNKKGSRFTEEFDGGKLKDLKQVDRLSNMFDDQDGGMLDYYDLTTARGKRNKKKTNNKQAEDRTQKIFKLTEITIPESITVKDLAAELKKTSAEVIKKLFGFGIMATINNDLDFDTAYLVAQEFGVNAIKK